MELFAALVYWLIVALWITVLGTIAGWYIQDPKAFGTSKLLLWVLAIDALRNIVENVYFGLFFGSQYGVLPASLSSVLGKPILLVIPKLLNIAAGCLVLALLLLRWLPMSIKERKQMERTTQLFQERAAIDGMTGLYNRSHFLEAATAEWDRYKRYRRSLCMLMLDIDEFKTVNDGWGHHAGDEVIIGLAQTLRNNKRRSDIVARLGGDEFAFILPESSIDDAMKMAERIRQAIFERAFSVDGRQIAVSVSIGISQARRTTGIIDMLKQADLALYEAKRRGRNRICTFDGVHLPGQPVAA